MSHSPTNYGFEGDPLLEAYMNAKFSEEISEMMKVPKRINANGILHEEILNGHDISSWNYHASPDMMTVPERIVVLGQDQHLGKNFFYDALLSFLQKIFTLFCSLLFFVCFI